MVKNYDVSINGHSKKYHAFKKYLKYGAAVVVMAFDEEGQVSGFF